MYTNAELSTRHKNIGCNLSGEYSPPVEVYPCFLQIPNILLLSLLQLVIKAPSRRFSIISVFLSFRESSAAYFWVKAAVDVPEDCAHMWLVGTNISATCSLDFFHLFIFFTILQALNNCYHFIGRTWHQFISTILFSAELDYDSSECFWFWS